jgi:hypothetical protein
MQSSYWQCMCCTYLDTQGFAHGLVVVKIDLEEDNVRELLHEL